MLLCGDFIISTCFFANSSSCTTTVLSKLLTSCHTAVKKRWIRYYDTVYERDGINYFWSTKNSNDVLNKFKSKNFQASILNFVRRFRNFIADTVPC